MKDIRSRLNLVNFRSIESFFGQMRPDARCKPHYSKNAGGIAR